MNVRHINMLHPELSLNIPNSTFILHQAMRFYLFAIVAAVTVATSVSACGEPLTPCLYDSECCSKQCNTDVSMSSFA